MPEWHTCSTIGFKGHTGAVFCDTGETKSDILILFHQKLSQVIYLWFMVNHEFTGNWIYGKMVLPGVIGGKNTSSVTPFSVLFSVVSSP